MAERKETLEKMGVIFVLWSGKHLQLEKRNQKGDKYFNYVLVPGGAVEPGETYQSAMKREVGEEYGVTPLEFEDLGGISTEEDGTIYLRHIFLVTKWRGSLKNKEKKDIHIKASLKEARILCTHPVTQMVLDKVESRLSR